MTLKEIGELINMLNQSNVSNFEIDHNGLKLKIGLGNPNGLNNEASIHKPKSTEKNSLDEKTTAEIYEEAASKEIESNYVYIKSPMVGAYYGSPSPDDHPFIKVGDRINSEQTVCIIEAMKIMNEINADIKGEVVEILVKDEDVVEYGQNLIKVRCLWW